MLHILKNDKFFVSNFVDDLRINICTTIFQFSFHWLLKSTLNQFDKCVFSEKEYYTMSKLTLLKWSHFEREKHILEILPVI